MNATGTRRWNDVSRFLGFFTQSEGEGKQPVRDSYRCADVSRGVDHVCVILKPVERCQWAYNNNMATSRINARTGTMPELQEHVTELCVANKGSQSQTRTTSHPLNRNGKGGNADAL